MALTDDNGMVMPVSPMYGGGFYGNGGNAFGGDWAWILLLLLLGWGNNGWGGGRNDGAGVASGNTLYPWMNQIDATQAGFNAMSTQNMLDGISSGIQALATQICNANASTQQALCTGFAGVNAAVNAGFAGVQAGANARQMANMQQAFAAQTAMSNGFADLSSQFANCCCENRLASANLAATIASENCADREALNYATRDIINNQTSSVQRILDQMCQDKIDAKNERIQELQNQLTLANLAASQNAQTGRILADNAAQTAALEQYLNPVPIPAYVVQNPNCCAPSYGCGCGIAP